MDPIRSRQEKNLATFKKLMATQVKLDIASAIRQHPHLDGQNASSAYQTLASDTSVNRIVEQLAREEVEDALAKGQVPAAAFLHIAGYAPNNMHES